MLLISKYILLFLIYAFMGWLFEIIVTFIQDHKFVNRGFMMGPVVPIYAIGGMLITLLLERFSSNLILLFFMSTIICSIIEYLISFLMEKLFKLRWWDYSDRFLNINGRICLVNAFLFGVLGTVVIKLFNPFFFTIIDKINSDAIIILSIILTVMFIVDFVISYIVISNIKLITKDINSDSTEEITKIVKDTIKKNKYLYNRIIKAFPNMHKIIKELKKEIKNKIKEVRE